MRDLNQRFYTNIPRLQKALYQRAVQDGYFAASPDSVRSRYGCFGGFVLLVAIFGGVGALVLFSGYSSTLICPLIAAAVFAIILSWLCKHMPVKSR